MQYVLGVDGGGTKTTALISTLDGVLLAKGVSGPSNYQFVGLDEALDNIAGAIDTAINLARIGNLPFAQDFPKSLNSSSFAQDFPKSLNPSSFAQDFSKSLNVRFAAACFGLSGIGRPIDRQIMRPALESLNIADRIILDHDAAIALAGAFACQPGVIVIAGTGSTAFGIDGSGGRQRAGGLGSILGDEGSGYYIGHKALVSAFRAYDGRGEGTTLVHKLVEKLNLSCLTDLVKRVYVDGMTRQEIASLVPLVLDAAREGDTVAGSILEDAGRELGIAAVAVIKKLGMKARQVQVAIDGGIFEAGELILSPFGKTIKETAPYAEIVDPRFKTVAGAVLMALKESGVGLSDKILGNVARSTPLEGKHVNSESMVTEKQNVKSLDIDKKTTEEIIRIINEEDKKVASAVEKEIPRIAAAVELIVDSLRNGGRLFYIGAGTSGRLGVIDASECPPTFGTDPELVQGVIAGGNKAVFRSQEGAEDDWEMGGKDLMASGLKPVDAVVGLSTSGRTPYVKGALEKARSIGCKTISIACNPDSEISRHAHVSILPIVGPEVITGSTRMKAGTAEKMVLNMLSTVAMIRLGKVSGNLMTSMSIASDKLTERAKRIIMSIAGVDYREAEDALEKAGGNVKAAVVMAKKGEGVKR